MVVSGSVVVYWLDSEKSWSVFTPPEMRSLDILIGWHVLQCQENLILYVVMDMVIQEGYDRAYFYERMIGMCFLPTFVDAKLDWTRRSQNSHHETQFYLYSNM